VSVAVLRLAVLALFDLDDPVILEDVLYRGPQLGIRVQHLFQDRVTLLGHQVVQRLRGRGLRVLVHVLSVRRVGRVLGDPPRDFLELHAVKDDGAGPDIDRTSVVF